MDSPFPKNLWTVSILDHLNQYLIQEVTLHEFLTMNLLTCFSLLYNNLLINQKINTSIVIKEWELEIWHSTLCISSLKKWCCRKKHLLRMYFANALKQPPTLYKTYKVTKVSWLTGNIYLYLFSQKTCTNAVFAISFHQKVIYYASHIMDKHISAFFSKLLCGK